MRIRRGTPFSNQTTAVSCSGRFFLNCSARWLTKEGVISSNCSRLRSVSIVKSSITLTQGTDRLKTTSFLIVPLVQLNRLLLRLQEVSDLLRVLLIKGFAGHACRTVGKKLHVFTKKMYFHSGEEGEDNDAYPQKQPIGPLKFSKEKVK